MSSGYDDVIVDLQIAYDRGAAKRDGAPKTEWKLAERSAFLDRIRPGGRLLEIGAGTGEDSVFFHQGGLDVLAVELSAEMVARSGGSGHEGRIEADEHLPPRFFSFRTDEQILDFVREFFEIVDFHVVASGPDLHFQSLTLRRPS